MGLQRLSGTHHHAEQQFGRCSQHCQGQCSERREFHSAAVAPPAGTNWPLTVTREGKQGYTQEDPLHEEYFLPVLLAKAILCWVGLYVVCLTSSNSETPIFRDSVPPQYRMLNIRGKPTQTSSSQ